MLEEGLIVFSNTHESIKADSLCQEKNIAASLIPTHPSISLGCGFMMRTSWQNFATLVKALDDNKIIYKALYYSTKQGIKRNIVALYEE